MIYTAIAAPIHTAGSDDVHVGRVRRTGLDAVEQVRVVAALAQLHDNVEQACLAFALADRTFNRRGQSTDRLAYRW